MIDSHKREYVNRGNALFPMQYYQCNTSEPLYNLPLHWHSDFEILHITEGEYNMFIGDSEKVLRTGDMAFLSGGVLHGDGAALLPCRFESAVFDPQMLRQRLYEQDAFLQLLLGENYINGGTTAVIEAIFRSNDAKTADFMQTALKFFSVLRKKSTGYALMATGLMTELLGIIENLHLYREKSQRNKSDDMRIKRIKCALDYMKENYASSVTLKTLSSSVCLSPRYFCRVFRETTRCSPIDYLNKYRVNRACGLLQSSTKSIKEVASVCGFTDISYFIRLFRRYKGLTPLKYKQSLSSLNGQAKTRVQGGD